MSVGVSRPSHVVGLPAVFGYAALLGVLTAGALSTAQVVRSTIDPVLAVAFSIYALALAIPFGLVVAFLSLGTALGLRRMSRRLAPSRMVAGLVGGFGVVVVGVGTTAFLTHQLFGDVQTLLWPGIAGSIIGGAAFLIWSLHCAEAVE